MSGRRTVRRGIHFKEFLELDGRGIDLLIRITSWNNEGEGAGKF